MSTPTVIAVGGLDDGAGAGLTRDAHTAAVLGVDCRLVGTAWTRQRINLRQGGFDARDAGEVATHLRFLLESAPPTNLAVKIGMVAQPFTANAVATCLESPEWSQLPVVFDPVLGSSSGLSLFRTDREILHGLLPLVRRASLLTPNRLELGALTGLAVRDLGQVAQAAENLLAAGARAVLVKGGHFDGPAVDRLFLPGSVTAFSRDRIAGRDPRGTGCALATAIAIHLGRGAGLQDACRAGGDWLATQIAGAVNRDGVWHLP
jgi:hydroxymethylpyrimidine/phosphomethylpyrimidine kinase